MPRLVRSPVAKEVGKRIWRARTAREMSHALLAEKLGLGTLQAVRLMEQGKIKVTLDRLLDICRVLESPLSFFLEGFLSSDQNAMRRISPEAIGIARAVDMTTDPQQRAQLLNIISAFTSATPAQIAAE